MNVARWSAVSAIFSLLVFHQTTLAQSLTEQVAAVSQINSQQPVDADLAIATDTTPSEQIFTVPSLWWQQQQQGDAINQRLINSWRAYDTSVSPMPHVDVVVNGQIWPLLSYLEQYAFITQFGESTQGYGYQLRIFIGERLVGLHVCNFSDEPIGSGEIANAEATLSAETICTVDLDYFGQGAIRGRSPR
ncbi:MAG: hypothetical protein ACFB2W_08140 [Leptolyngbyaceae cyanobacterium]